ncbi:hypothetical protein V5O48_010160 [Marasmius crinis-equi]|uniref:FBD domain-containing protein n=1 Tax=Marasmius crinis-equi TaxID=585013 RepID=A0ABR3F949_9AGAR
MLLDLTLTLPPLSKSVTLPSRFFGKVAAASHGIRHVHLHGLDPRSFPFSHLTTLNLRRPDYFDRLSLDQLLVILRNSPDLEVLRLEECLGVSEDPPISVENPVKFPRLRRLRLGYSPAMSCKVFRHIYFPNVEDIFLGLSRTSEQADSLLDTMELLASSLSPDSLSSFHLAKLDVPRSLIIQVSPYGESQIMTFACSPRKHMARGAKDVDKAIFTVLQGSIFTKFRVTCLDIESPECHIPTDIVRKHFGHSKCLEQLVLVGEAVAATFINTLGRHIEDDEAPHPSQTPTFAFPSLNKLHFVDADLCNDIDYSKVSAFSDSPVVPLARGIGLVQFLIASLRLRMDASKEGGFAVGTIDVEEPTEELEEKALALIEEAVDPYYIDNSRGYGRLRIPL